MSEFTEDKKKQVKLINQKALYTEKPVTGVFL